MDINEARKRIESLWSGSGECGSCGWHGALSEHDIDDDDIAEAIKNGCALELGCVNKDDEERYSHRGVKIYFGEER